MDAWRIAATHLIACGVHMILVAGCSRTRPPATPPPPPASHAACGDLAAVDDENARPLVERAIALTNALLGKNAAARLRSTWHATEPAAIPGRLGRLPVPSPTAAEVPQGHRCIIVSPDRLDFAAIFGGNGSR